MNLLGSKTLETERLLLRKTEKSDLKKLWEILLDRDISRYYLTCKINDNWKDEKKWQYKKLERASNPDMFCWTIIRKDNNEVIGQITVQEGTTIDKSIRDIGWFISKNNQRKGYAYEAASKVLNYMFKEVEINKITTSVAMINPASWGLMEKLGFKRLETTHKNKYYFVEEEVDSYEYELTKEEYEGVNNG